MPVPEEVVPVEKIEELESVPDPWEFESSIEKLPTRPRLVIVLNNILLLPPTKEAPAPIAKRKAGRPKKEVAPAPKRRGRPRKAA
jgi:hypothetical protein